MTDEILIPNDQPQMDSSDYVPPAPMPPVPMPPVQEPYQYAVPMPAPPASPKKEKKARIGVPGITGFGFTSSLLALFLLPLFKEAFSNYIFYDGSVEFLLRYYYYAAIGLGGASALFALLGFILTPIGVHISRRRQRDGAALGVAGILIAIVALLLIVGVTLSHSILYNNLYPH
ncbi:MAG: hypothetical protein WDA02_00875 [Saccharofermentanales bacterium]